MKRFFYIIYLVFVACGGAKAQYFTVYQGDSIFFANDSVELKVEGTPFDISWQASSDLKNWTDLGKYGNKIKIAIDSTAYYRAVGMGEGCPEKSDTIVAGMKKKMVGNTFTLGKEACIYQLPSGIMIKAMQGSVKNPLLLDITEYDSLQAITSMPFPADEGKKHLCCIDFNQNIAPLLQPVKIRIPTHSYKAGDLPAIFLYNPGDSSWTSYLGTIICSASHKYIEITMNSLCPFRIDSRCGALLQKNNLKVLPNQGNQGVDNINCFSTVRITTSSSDNSLIQRGQNCYVIKIEDDVSFPLCESMKDEYFRSTEIGADCIPQVDVMVNNDINKKFIKVGDVFKLSFFVYINTGSEKSPIEGQWVTIQLPDGLNLVEDIRIPTNSKGIKEFTLVAEKENLNAIVNYFVEFDYCIRSVVARNQEVSEKNCEEYKIFTSEKKYKRIMTYNECTSPDAIICSRSNDPECELIKSQLPIKIQVDPPEKNVFKGKTTTVKCDIFNYLDEIITPSITTKWSSEDSSYATIDEQGLILTYDKAGKVNITSELCNFSDDCLLTILECDRNTYTVNESEMNMSPGYRKKINYQFNISEANIDIPEINFESSNPSVAMVSNKGIVTAVQMGEANITIKWCNEIRNVKVNVSGTRIYTITLNSIKEWDFQCSEGSSSAPTGYIQRKNKFSKTVNASYTIKETINQYGKVKDRTYLSAESHIKEETFSFNSQNMDCPGSISYYETQGDNIFESSNFKCFAEIEYFENSTYVGINFPYLILGMLSSSWHAITVCCPEGCYGYNDNNSYNQEIEYDKGLGNFVLEPLGENTYGGSYEFTNTQGWVYCGGEPRTINESSELLIEIKNSY